MSGQSVRSSIVVYGVLCHFGSALVLSCSPLLQRTEQSSQAGAHALFAVYYYKHEWQKQRIALPQNPRLLREAAAAAAAADSRADKAESTWWRHVNDNLVGARCQCRLITGNKQPLPPASQPRPDNSISSSKLLHGSTRSQALFDSIANCRSLSASAAALPPPQVKLAPTLPTTHRPAALSNTMSTAARRRLMRDFKVRYLALPGVALELQRR